MTSTPTVSVVVATHNRAAMLERLLDALGVNNGRGSSGYEVVIVDDGSTDATAAVVERAGIRRVVTAHAGPAAARNRGWREATGEIIVFTDDDCVPAHDWVESLVDALDTAPTIDGVGGGIVPYAHGFFEDFEHAERLADHGIAADGSVRYLVTANAAFRRVALERVSGFDESFPNPAGEDVDLSERILATGGTLAIAPHALVAHDYRRGFGQLFRTYWRHGAARSRLARRHEGLDVARGRRGAVSRAALADRHRRYRAATSPGVALAYTMLRVQCLAVFGAAVMTERLRAR